MAQPDKESYAGASVLLIDPDKGSRDTLRTILFDRGFRRFRYGESNADIERELSAEPAHVLITETNLPDGDPCGLISSIRHSRTGDNPFLPIIVTTWKPTPELVRRIVDSGIDDLVIKPVSVGGLVSRVENLIHNRKQFVVTSDYIGPDRHDTPGRSDDETVLIEVPNALKSSITGSPQEVSAQTDVRKMIAEINLHKLERYAVDIVTLVNMLTPKMRALLFDEAAIKLLERLQVIAGDSHRRMEGTKYSHVSELSDTLAKVTTNLLKFREKSAPKDIRLLKPLSQAIQGGFDSSDVTAAAARAISDTIGTDKVDLKEIRSSLHAKAGSSAQKLEPGMAPASKDEPSRRSKFILRLLIARVSHLFRSGDLAGQRLPREFIRGFDNYLRKLLGSALYSELNDEAKDLLNVIEADEDTEIWKKIYVNAKYRVFSMNILIKFLEKFENFNRGKRYFMSIINAAVMEDSSDGGHLEDFVMDDGQFSMVFGTMFSDIFKIMGDEEHTAGFDKTFGGGTWARLDGIRTAYQEYLVVSSGAPILKSAKISLDPATETKA